VCLPLFLFIYPTQPPPHRLAASAPIYLTEEQAVSFLQATQCPVLLFRGDNGWPADAPEEEQRRIQAFGACVV
jgi:hypothetical protein